MKHTIYAFFTTFAMLLVIGAGCLEPNLQSGENLNPPQYPPGQGNYIPEEMPNGTATTTPQTDPETGTTFCTMDVKKCPDGSYVGRIGPNCEFMLCPNTR